MVKGLTPLQPLFLLYSLSSFLSIPERLSQKSKVLRGSLSAEVSSAHIDFVVDLFNLIIVVSDVFETPGPRTSFGDGL